MKTVRIKITAIVETTVTLNEGETIENLKQRNVDIYLHGEGENGHRNKVDLGSDFGGVRIEVID